MIFTRTHLGMRVPIPRTRSGFRPHREPARRDAVAPAAQLYPIAAPRDEGARSHLRFTSSCRAHRRTHDMQLELDSILADSPATSRSALMIGTDVEAGVS
jgi:hypothetical protein